MKYVLIHTFTTNNEYPIRSVMEITLVASRCVSLSHVFPSCECVKWCRNEWDLPYITRYFVPIVEDCDWPSSCSLEGSHWWCLACWPSLICASVGKSTSLVTPYCIITDRLSRTVKYITLLTWGQLLQCIGVFLGTFSALHYYFVKNILCLFYVMAYMCLAHCHIVLCLT